MPLTVQVSFPLLLKFTAPLSLTISNGVGVWVLSIESAGLLTVTCSVSFTLCWDLRRWNAMNAGGMEVAGQWFKEGGFLSLARAER